jgi:sulfatase maturation enzyme AslB (radical SAM superfamily)
MIRYTRDNGIFSEITTNGMLLNRYNGDVLEDNGLGGIIISVDSSNPDKFKKTRHHVNPQTVRNNIALFVNAHGSRIQTSINSVIREYTRDNIMGMTRYAEDMAVDSIQFLHLIDGTNEQGFLKGNFGTEVKESVRMTFEEAKSYGKSRGLLVLTPELDIQVKKCTLIEKSITVAYDGRANPCCRLDRSDMSYPGKMPFSMDTILKEHKTFSQKYFDLDFCRLCTQFLWNYDVIMTKFKYALDKKRSGGGHEV